MSDDVERRAAGLVVVFFRFLAGRHQHELSDRTGIDQKRISRYELGEVRPQRSTLERMAARVGVSSARLDQLLALFRAVCAESAAERPTGDLPAAEAPEAGRREDLDEIAAEIAECLKPGIYEALIDFETEIAAGADPPLSPEAARARAAELWQRLVPRTQELRRMAIEHGREYRTWAFCERVCEESFEATARDPESAQALADLALSVAELAPGSEATRQRVMAYALAYAAQADRMAGEAEEANDKLRRAKELWREGDGSDDLDDRRIADLLPADA